MPCISWGTIPLVTTHTIYLTAALCLRFKQKPASKIKREQSQSCRKSAKNELPHRNSSDMLLYFLACGFDHSNFIGDLFQYL